MSASPTGDELKDLQVQIKEFLEGKDYFSDASAGEDARPIGIVLEDAKSIDARIATLTAKAGGLAVLIVTPGGKNGKPDMLPATYDPATSVCRVYENPTVNRRSSGIGETGSKVAHAIFKLLHQETMPMGCMLLSVDRQPGNDPRYQTHDVFIETTIQLSEEEPVRGDRSVVLTVTPTSVAVWTGENG